MKRRRTGRVLSTIMTVLLSTAMVFTMMPFIGTPVYGEDGGTLNVQTPVLVVTGTGFLDEGAYSKTNVTAERSYSLPELKGMAADTEYIYSAKKQKDPFTKSYHAARGIELGVLIDGLAGISERISVIASDGYVSTFMEGGTYNNVPNSVSGVGSLKTSALEDIEPAPGLGEPRYWYENFEEGNAEEVPAVIAWNYAENESAVPASAGEQDKNLKLFVGQLGGEVYDGPEDMNGPLLNGGSKAAINKVVVGSEIAETALTIGEDAYTRAEILMMDYADAVYTYETSDGPATDYVRGVPMSVLLDGYNDDDVVNFEAADGYKVTVSGYTVKQLIDNDYMLAYEMGETASDIAGIYETAKKDPTKFGFFRLYGADENGKPAKLVNKISITSASGIDFAASPYKHITNGGQQGSSPYNIDSITGATLTVEGPGVDTSVPVSVKDLEGRNAGAARADYTDKREGSDTTRTYEGIDLYFILHNMTSGDSGIKLNDLAKKVLIKNRNRNTIAEFTLEQIEEAHATDTPIMVAYGTSLTDGTNIRPFVFDGAAGADPDLGNEDGCIKLVYNKNSITGDTNSDYTSFGNMAYIYVAEDETPGYKHDKDPYQSSEISNYVLTVTGDKIGREVNYTVQQLEDMVEYDSDGKPDNSGMGYRDEYSLANSNYWYVNEYEGIQLWKLLLKSGLDPSLANDNETIVSSTATDGYAATDKFTIKQVADPNSFGFYEKNPADPNAAGWSDENNEVLRDPDHPKGDLIAKGYPVLVAYGVNGYPYVEKNTQDGYLSGLQNDGGPLRIISGKLYYGHANGSNQAKYLDKVVVGDDTNHYSTHKYHTDGTYTSLSQNEITVRILNGAADDAPVLKEKTYTIGDIEELIYGGKLTKNQLAEARINTFYQLAKNGKAYSDLYEGINLNFFLQQIVELPGAKGTITFNNDENNKFNLEDVLSVDNGSNTETGMTGLAPLLAFGKNGAPMVESSSSDGYEKNVTLAEGTEYQNSVTIKNDGGPLAVLFPHTDNSVSDKAVTNVTSITINLSPDKFAHTSEPYSSYADYAVTVKGEGTRLDEPLDITLGELESKQTIAFTGDYSILKTGATDASEVRYRGIDLYKLLASNSIGLKANADKVIITPSDGDPMEFSLSDIKKSYMNSVTGETGLPVLLAYGKGVAGSEDKEDGIPLVANKSSDGYDAAYGNDGGPVRLVIGQTETGDVNSGKNLKFVKSIEVTASEMTSWNHNSSEVFKQYRDETVQLLVTDSDGGELYNKTYTVGEIEDNTSLVERIEAYTEQTNTWEGINLWRWVKQEAGSVEGIDDPVSVTEFSADGANRPLLSNVHLDGLENGVLDGGNYVPIILAYGINGYPLAIGDKTYPNGEGFDATVGNNGGPLRMIVHNNKGISLTYVTKIVVVVGGGGSQPEEPVDFTIKGLKDGDIEMSVDDIKNLKNKAGDNVGQAEAEYIRKGVTKKVKGALLKNILTANGIDNENTVITLNTPDAFEATEKGASYNNITLKQAIEQKYFVAYQEFIDGEWKDIDDTVKGMDVHTNLRMYRNYCDATEGANNQTDWYDECTNVTAITLAVPDSTQFKEYPTTGGIRSTWMDKDGTIWVGTYGGGLYSKKAGDDSFTVLNTGSTPALKTDFTSAVAADADGGIWASQNASYSDQTNNQGVLYIRDGEVRQYLAGTDPATIPNNYVQAIKVDSDGKVWFGSFGGLTIYDPAADTWTTYGKADKEDFPATSINTITLDGEGGAWLGFYPDGSGTAEKPYVGGFCHIDKDGNVDKVKKETGDSAPKFAQIWVRSIAIDKKGTVWAIASGTNLEDNVGGVIWKWKSGNDAPERYTGKEVLGDYLDGSKTTEVRTVAVDKDGSLWFGTSADGVLKVDNPKLVDGKMTVSAQYAKETGSWSAANMNNIYSIDFWNEGTAYVGSAGGLLVLGDEPESGGGEEPEVTPETVAEDIAALPQTVTVNDKEAIEKARSDYESLTEEEKASLPAGTVEKLEAAEAKLVAAEVKDTVESIRELSETIVAAVAGGYTDSKYTASTYMKYEQALTAAQAVMADPNASKADIDAANRALAEAKAALVEKSDNTMRASGKTRTVKAAKVKKAKRKVSAISVKKPVGTVTYKKAGGSARLTVDTRTGKITVKKGTKKGKYKIRVKVSATGGDNHKPLTKTVKVTIKVK